MKGPSMPLVFRLLMLVAGVAVMAWGAWIASPAAGLVVAGASMAAGALFWNGGDDR